MPRLARFAVHGLALSCLLFTALPALAQPWPAPIRTIEQQGVTIIKQFKAPDGMTGFAARAGNRPLALYLTPDRKHVIVGTLLDADGNNLTKPVLDAAVDKPNRQSAWPKLEQSSWVADGKDDAPRKIYVFTDPNCPYCHKFYEIARPWVEAGKVQLRHIPVGILKPTSAGKAAAILAADDPGKALRRHESNYERGGIEPMDDIPSQLRQKVSANNMLMSSLGVRGTPGMFYRGEDGEVGVKQGVPQGAERDKILGPR